MSTSCPYRHTSYASWRYLTFKRLFADHGYPARATPIPLAAPKNNYFKRQFSTSFRTRAGSVRHTRRDGGAHRHLRNHLDVDNATKVAELGRNKKRQWQPDCSTLEHREELLHGSGDASIECNEHECTEKQRDGTGVARDRPKKAEALTKPWQRQQWSPYHGWGREDMKALAGRLQLGPKPAESPTYVDDDVSGQDEISDRLPVSPLVQAYEQEKPTKSPMKSAEKEELAENPWATMLASPMRLCSATGVRLPKDLLVPWGLVRNPATGDVYFMPSELADLDSLKDPRRRTKSSASVSTRGPNMLDGSTPNQGAHARPLSAGADIGLEKENLKVGLRSSHHQNNRVEADPGFVTGQMASHSPKASPPSPPTVYMLPFLPLLHHLTMRFTFLQEDMVTRRSKPNALNSILPWRIKAGVDRAKAYTSQGGSSLPSSLPKEASKAPPLASLQHVKWEPDMNGVMLRILRERLLAALEMLGNRNQKLWRKRRELVRAIRVTKTANTGREGENWKLLAHDNHNGDVTDGDQASDVSGAEICLLVEPKGGNPPTAQLANHKGDGHNFQKEERLDGQETTQASGSTFIEVIESSTAIAGRWSDYSAFTPSDMEVDQSRRVPLFLLNDLLDNDCISRFRLLSTTIGVLAPRVSAASIGNQDTYALIIPAEAFGGKSVIEEVWRLWRFLGGRPQ